MNPKGLLSIFICAIFPGIICASALVEGRRRTPSYSESFSGSSYSVSGSRSLSISRSYSLEYCKFERIPVCKSKKSSCRDRCKPIKRKCRKNKRCKKEKNCKNNKKVCKNKKFKKNQIVRRHKKCRKDDMKCSSRKWTF